METVAAIFDSRATAEDAVKRIHSLGIPNDRIALLTPDKGIGDPQHTIPVDDTEAPGEGRALGGVVGGALGAAGGMSLGAAIASLVIPGVGPVIAGGILGAAILGAGGTATGMAVGKAMDESLAEGLPHDELFVYELALRKGKSVVIAFVDNIELANGIDAAFEAAGAESIDVARENWWLELRAAEEAQYASQGKSFSNDEKRYRAGFEAALGAKTRNQRYEDALPTLTERLGSECREDAFQCGYDRGHEYYESLTR